MNTLKTAALFLLLFLGTATLTLQAQERHEGQQEKHEQKQQRHEQKETNKRQQREQKQVRETNRRQNETNRREGGSRGQREGRLSTRSYRRIPEDHFRTHFGREHNFRIGHPVLVDGFDRFQYGGYWFGFVEPFPIDWSYEDDVYVDFVDDGYYLYNPFHPGVRVLISVN